ncbi:SMI1/KNR4 family protein [Porphyromonas sp. oral taxon 275]|uniref:SMI1/KNR4 family protein n=1 Tax=Porphyromonas sp. oral taxon 275 TaxID=712435 RepID=UPI001BAC2197|nr:SMI1/KNR4 family protein [Porphyromonas sp. oral taxon 275]QUB42363.1 SMI1/KNR4 family protein [Porphyromonas sp. oral taxon 275]
MKVMIEQEILVRLSKRREKIKNLCKIPISDVFYLSFISTYEGIEITPDIDILGYEQSLIENRLLNSTCTSVWLIGRTGQGDEWFIDRESNCVLFFDHNQGEHSSNDCFVNLKISFFQFLQLAFLYQALEKSIEKQEVLNDNVIKVFIDTVNSIAPNLYSLYPFAYFKNGK